MTQEIYVLLLCALPRPPLPHGGAFASLEEARLEGAYHLDAYFNLDRRHSALGYRSPHQFEQDYCPTTL